MTSALLRTVADFRSRLLANEAQAAQAMEAAHAETLRRIEAELTKLYDAMVEAIASGQPWSLHKLYEANRLEALKRLIAGEIDQFGALARTMAGRLQQDGVHLGLDAAMQIMQAQIPPGVSWSFGVPPMEALAQLVGATQRGSPLAQLFAGFGAEAAMRAEQALIAGVSLGQNPREFAGQIKDALGASRQRALTISRQESLRCYRGAALESYRANDDVVGQWRWTCAKNRRTCAACIAMDGKLFPLSREFFGHVQCRCTPVPVTRSWAEIFKGIGIDTSSVPDTRPRIRSGPDWFSAQPEEIKQAILGAAKYAAYNAGKFDLADIVKHCHSADWGESIQEKSLKELVK